MGLTPRRVPVALTPLRVPGASHRAMVQSYSNGTVVYTYMAHSVRICRSPSVRAWMLDTDRVQQAGEKGRLARGARERRAWHTPVGGEGR